MADLVIGLGRTPFEVLQQSAQRLVANDIFQAECADGNRRGRNTIDRYVAETLVGSRRMVKIRPLREDMPQMAFAENNEMVETLRLRPPRICLSDRIQIGTFCRNGPKLDAVGFKNRTVW